MKAPTLQQRAAAADLLDLIDRTFFTAYHAHANGMSEDELLIDYDIEAAFSDVEAAVRDTCRLTIKSAVKAVDRNVNFIEARNYLRDQLQRKLSEIFVDKAPRKRRDFSRRHICDSIRHAMD